VRRSFSCLLFQPSLAKVSPRKRYDVCVSQALFAPSLSLLLLLSPATFSLPAPHAVLHRFPSSRPPADNPSPYLYCRFCPGTRVAPHRSPPGIPTPPLVPPLGVTFDFSAEEKEAPALHPPPAKSFLSLPLEYRCLLHRRTASPSNFSTKTALVAQSIFP